MNKIIPSTKKSSGWNKIFLSNFHAWLNKLQFLSVSSSFPISVQITNIRRNEKKFVSALVTGHFRRSRENRKTRVSLHTNVNTRARLWERNTRVSRVLRGLLLTISCFLCDRRTKWGFCWASRELWSGFTWSIVWILEMSFYREKKIGYDWCDCVRVEVCNQDHAVELQRYPVHADEIDKLDERDKFERTQRRTNMNNINRIITRTLLWIFYLFGSRKIFLISLFMLKIVFFFIEKDNNRSRIE